MLPDLPYLMLAPAMVVEGPVATFVGGTLVGAGQAALVVVWLLAFGIDLVVDSALFALGRAGRRPRVARRLVRLGLTQERRERLEAGARGNLGQLVGGAKLVDAGAVPAFLATGLSGVAYGRFLAVDAVFTALRVSVLLGAGALLGTHVASRVAGFFDRPWVAVGLSLGLGLVLLTGRWLVLRALAARRVAGPRRRATVLVGGRG